MLVDGGKSETQCIEYLKRHHPERHLSVVICTHNDKDHAEGVRGLLTSKDEFEVSEVWLPGRWTDRLIELCEDDDAFYAELAQNVADIQPERRLEDLPVMAPTGEEKQALAEMHMTAKRTKSCSTPSKARSVIVMVTG